MPRDTTRANTIFGPFFAAQTNLPLYRHELNTHKKSVEDDMARFRYCRLSGKFFEKFLKAFYTIRAEKAIVRLSKNVWFSRKW